jgi:carbon-monoxide dehydrogenase medium subunit
VAAEEFFQGHFTTGLADDECLVEVRVPTTAAGVGWAFEEVARRHGDFAIVGVAAMVALARAGTVADSRITLIGVADRPLRARDAESGLVGAQPSTEAFDAAARTAAARLEPASDVHGSAAFRRHLAMIVVRRALTNAAARAEVPS